MIFIVEIRLDLSRTTKNTAIKTSDNDSPAHVTVSDFTENKTIYIINTPNKEYTNNSPEH
jgi:hypothetical protein